MNSLNNLNWVDIFILAIIARSLFIGLQRGVVIEIFKLVGAFLAVFITLHYFSSFSTVLKDRVHFPKGSADVFSFTCLWLATALIFKFVRDGFMLLLHIEAHSVFDRWGGLVLSFLRGLLICSLAIVLLRISSVEYLWRVTEISPSGSRIVRFAPKFYEATFYGFVNKFFPSEELNKDASPLGEAKSEKGKS